MPTDPNSSLTGGEAETLEGRILALLDEAGLELWQAPQGFWAIRAKGTVATAQPVRATRKRRQEGRA